MKLLSLLLSLVVSTIACLAAPSTTTSYFLNVEAFTNVTARSALKVSTNSLTSDGGSPALPLWNGNAIGVGGGDVTYNNVYVTNLYSTTSYFTDVNVTNLYVTNAFINDINVTNVTVNQTFNLKGSSTLYFTNHTFIATNTFLFNTSTGVISASLNAGNGISITGGTNIAVNEAYDFALTGSPTFTKNLGAVLAVGNTTFVDLSRASQTNSITGALTIAHATNGVHGLELTHVRWLFVPSGGPHTLTIPSGWRTNVYSAVPPALTNTTIYRMVVASGGPTADAASQTNCYVSFEYYK